MTESLHLSTQPPETSFWHECARLVESYATRPEKYSATTEQAQLKDRLVQLSLTLANSTCPSPYWRAGASVGFGQWAQMPWLAVYDSRETRSAQEGTYIVIHFSWEEPRGIRIGISVAATEYKRNAAKRAKEVRDELDPTARQALASSEFTDSTDPAAVRVDLGSGKRAADYADSMVFEKFVSLETLKTDLVRLTADFGLLLSVYKAWSGADTRPIEPDRPEGLDFSEVIRRYHAEQIVFLSPNDKAEYFIESVDESGCSSSMPEA